MNFCTTPSPSLSWTVNKLLFCRSKDCLSPSAFLLTLPLMDKAWHVGRFEEAYAVCYVSLAISIPRISLLELFHRQMGLPPPDFPLPRMAPTIVGCSWKQKEGGGGGSCLWLGAPRRGLCMRASEPDLLHGLEGDWLCCPHLCKSALPPFLPYLLSDLRIRNSKRVRVMMPKTLDRWEGPSLGVYRPYRGGSRPPSSRSKGVSYANCIRVINRAEQMEGGRVYRPT